MHTPDHGARYRMTGDRFHLLVDILLYLNPRSEYDLDLIESERGRGWQREHIVKVLCERLGVADTDPVPIAPQACRFLLHEFHLFLQDNAPTLTTTSIDAKHLLLGVGTAVTAASVDAFNRLCDLVASGELTATQLGGKE